MSFAPRVWGAGKLLILVGGLVATFVVFAAIAMRVAVRAREVQVPQLAGRPLDEARALAADLDLVVRVDEARRPDGSVPAGMYSARIRRQARPPDDSVGFASG